MSDVIYVAYLSRSGYIACNSNVDREAWLSRPTTHENIYIISI